MISFNIQQFAVMHAVFVLGQVGGQLRRLCGYAQSLLLVVRRGSTVHRLDPTPRSGALCRTAAPLQALSSGLISPAAGTLQDCYGGHARRQCH